LSTRAISRQTCGLSGERFSTQFEITTSTLASATGRCSISPSRNSTFEKPVCCAYDAMLPRALRSISGVMSTPITRPRAPTFAPAMKQSKPPPAPRSSTVSPSRRSATAVGFPQESPMFAPSGVMARSPCV